MSAEKHKSDSRRWLSQALADIQAAKKSKDTESFEWACFQSQQAAEKALKALWFHSELDPWGHSVYRLITEFSGDTAIKDLADDGLLLDKLYIPTRYPNGLPDLAPHEAYGRRDADGAIEASEKIMQVVIGLIEKTT
ncbi:MAG: HEPN domain-containing protein [Spirochaetales bacterium]|jgi:HEPN domain-containing protein|nr:HEPN domain-containing protein [Spirochaetales bacterium]